MRQNIVNLTDQLIQRHRLDEAWKEKGDRFGFEVDVEKLLRRTSLKDMKGPRLAEIYAYFEVTDLTLEQHDGDLHEFAELCSDPEAFHRAIDAFFLARIITNRLDPEMASRVLPYRKANRNSQPVEGV